MRAHLSDGTYHRDIFIPGTPEFTGDWLLYYTKHAIAEIIRDRYARNISGDALMALLPHNIRIGRADAARVEATFDGGKCIKLVLRLDLGSGLDIVLVLLDYSPGVLLVKTAWFNRHSDNHATLDRSKYVCP